MIILSILLPFLSFFFQGKIIQAIIAFVLQIVAGFTFVFFGLGFVIWLILAFWALSSYHNHKADKRIQQLSHQVKNKA